MPDTQGYKNTHTHTEYVTHCFSTATMVRERVSVLRLMYTACLVGYMGVLQKKTGKQNVCSWICQINCKQNTLPVYIDWSSNWALRLIACPWPAFRLLLLLHYTTLHCLPKLCGWGIVWRYNGRLKTFTTLLQHIKTLSKYKSSKSIIWNLWDIFDDMANMRTTCQK
jgi:hypothetical protein